MSDGGAPSSGSHRGEGPTSSPERRGDKRTRSITRTFSDLEALAGHGIVSSEAMFKTMQADDRATRAGRTSEVKFNITFTIEDEVIEPSDSD